MISLRKAHTRGHAEHGWLDSWHSFSFADYHDPAHMGVGNLRVINEDRIAPGSGFGTHGHRDMEIVSYVLDGALAHKDSMGNSSRIVPGEVQRMSAGTGVRHSEYNDAADQTTHFLQIWLLPDVPGGEPGYEQKAFATEGRRGQLALMVSPGGAAGSVRVRADARIWAGFFDGAESQTVALDASRATYVHLARGGLTVNGHALEAGDALTLTGESHLSLERGHDAEVLVFDLKSRA
jgi:redox-sensitive bicupin YhaK (pirin superfamily)